MKLLNLLICIILISIIIISCQSPSKENVDVQSKSSKSESVGKVPESSKSESVGKVSESSKSESVVQASESSKKANIDKELKKYNNDNPKKNIFYYYLELPKKYFRYGICGEQDNQGNRLKSIKVINTKKGYIKFEEECGGPNNEIVLFKDRSKKADLITFTTPSRNIDKAFYLLELTDGKWIDRKADYFPDKETIYDEIQKQIKSFDNPTQTFLKENSDDGKIPIEFLLPENGYNIEVIVDRDLTREPLHLLAIRWEKNKFVIRPTTEPDKTTIFQKTTQRRTNNQLYAAVKKNDRWDFIRPDGSYLTNEKFTYADNFSCGLACVGKFGQRGKDVVYNATYYFIDVDGNRPTNITYEGPIRYHEDRAIVGHKGKAAIIDKKGKIIATGFSSIQRFSEGLAVATKNRESGCIFKDGSWAFKIGKRTRIHTFSEGLAKARKDGLMGYINRTGEWSILPTWKEAHDFFDGRAVIKKNDKYGFIDVEGNLVIPAIYDDVGHFKEGICHVAINKKWGFIDKSGNQITALKYDACDQFVEGLGLILIDKKVGYLNKKGDLAIPPKFDGGISFLNGFAIVEQDLKMGYIDALGNFTIQPQYERLNNFVYPEQTNLFFRR